MTRRAAGIALAVAHVALVGALGLKLLADRARLPRAWARTMPFDPSLPIRGRYVRLRLEVPLASLPEHAVPGGSAGVRLEVEDGRLRGVSEPQSGVKVVNIDTAGVPGRGALAEPTAFFIPEHVPDPSVRPPGEELWAEVTIPRSGAPRPIRLGVLKNGQLTPLEIR